MTSYVHRILLIVPAAKVAAVVAWFQANIDPSFDPLLGPPLNPSGLIVNPVTHRWMCGSYADAQCRSIIIKLCQLAAVTPPTNNQWNVWTQANVIAWLLTVQAAIHTNYGVWVTLSDNTGSWGDPEAALAAMNLKRLVDE